MLSEEQIEDKDVLVLPPDTDANERTYGELALRVGQLDIAQQDHSIVRVKFWGQQKPIYMSSQNGRFGGGILSQQQYAIKCPMLLFLAYLEEGVNLIIDIVDKRNSKLIGTALLRWELYLTQFHKNQSQEFVLSEQLAIIKQQQTSLKALPEQIGTITIHLTLDFAKSIKVPRPKSQPKTLQQIRQQAGQQASILQQQLQQQQQQQQQHVIDEDDFFDDGVLKVETLPNYQQARRARQNPNEVQQRAVPLVEFDEAVAATRSYINPMEQIELELLRLQDDAARLFPSKVSDLPPPPPMEQPTNENDMNVYNLRSVDSLTVNVQKLQLLPALGDKMRDKLRDKMFTIDCKVPILRGSSIAYQSFLIQDISRTPTSVSFESQMKCHLRINDQNWQAVSQCQCTFKVLVAELNFEVGVGVLPLSTMIMDGLKFFTYEVPIMQPLKKKMEIVALLVVSIQLGGDVRAVESKRETQIETQILQLKTELQDQIERQREDMELAKQAQVADLGQQLQSMQIFLHVEQLEYVDPSIAPCNFALKCKPYGVRGDKLESETMWGSGNPYFDFSVTTAVTLDVVAKMEHTLWVLELWNVVPGGGQVLLGICKLSLGQIHAQVFEGASPASYIKFVKTNLYPILLYDSDLPVESLRSKETLGILRLKLAFGTYAQIMRYQKQIARPVAVQVQVVPPILVESVQPSSIPSDLPQLESIGGSVYEQVSEEVIDYDVDDVDEDDFIAQPQPHYERPPVDQPEPKYETQPPLPSYGRAVEAHIEDHLKSFRHTITINLVSLINYQLPQLHYQLQVNLFGTDLVADSQIVHLADSITQIQFSTQFTLSGNQLTPLDTPALSLHRTLHETSIILFLFDSETHALIAKGSLPSEEIIELADDTKAITFISLYSREEVARVQVQMSHHSELVGLDQIPQQQSEVVVVASQLSSVVAQQQQQQQQQPLSLSAITRKLQPEFTYTIKLRFNQLYWLRTPSNLKSDYFRIEVYVDHEQLDFALPHLTTSEYATKIFQDMQHLNMTLDYVIVCDRIMINQISKSNFMVELTYLHNTKVVHTYHGRIPMVGIFGERGLEGDIPLFNKTDQLTCTLSLAATLTTQHDDDVLLPHDDNNSSTPKQLNYKNRYYLHITELLLLSHNHNDDNDLDELYFMLVDPVTQSESYKLDFGGSQAINTSDCVLALHNQPQLSMLQLRSLSLGEDKLIGWVEVQTQQIIEEIKCEANYLVLHLADEVHGMSCRVGVKVIQINYDQDNLAELEPLFALFEPQHLNALRQCDGVSAIKQYMRSTLKLSYSEIAFFFNLVDGQHLERLFSNELYIPSRDFVRLNQHQDLIIELAREFAFYDHDQSGFMDPKHLKTILGFFDLPADSPALTQFIPAKQTQHFKDDYVTHIKKQNMFDYLKFLNYLQQANQDLTKFFQLNQLGPLKHQVQRTITQYSPIRGLPVLQEIINQQDEPAVDESVVKEEDNVKRNLSQILEDLVEDVAPLIPPPPPKKQQIYSSSDGSSNKQVLKEVTSSSGTQLQKIEAKLPAEYKDPEYIKRIEEIMKRNHLNFGVFDRLSSDSDDY